MGLYPVNLEIKKRLCLVVGGGSVALRKARALLEAGAKVRIISPEFVSITPDSRLPTPDLIKRPYKKGDLKGAFLAVAATDNPQVNRAIAEEAKKEKVLLNIVDKPEFCDFFVPSFVSRGDLLISISTGGKFPALSKKLRKQLELQFGSEYGKYLELLGAARDKVIAKYADSSKRKEILQHIVNMPLIELIKQGKIEEAQKEIEKEVEESTPDSPLPTLD